MNKLKIDNDQFRALISKICRDIAVSGWRPDYIVGITRGGLIPAVMISHYLGVPMKSLDVSLRDGGDTVSNCGMAEDALGYPKAERFVEDENDVGAILDAAGDLLEQGDTYKNILIVDDINDTGATFNWIMKDWPAGCLPNDPDWEHVWNNNVMFSSIVNNVSNNSTVEMDFSAIEVSSLEGVHEVNFPYDEWWKR